MCSRYTVQEVQPKRPVRGGWEEWLYRSVDIISAFVSSVVTYLKTSPPLGALLLLFGEWTVEAAFLGSPIPSRPKKQGKTTARTQLGGSTAVAVLMDSRIQTIVITQTRTSLTLLRPPWLQHSTFVSYCRDMPFLFRNISIKPQLIATLLLSRVQLTRTDHWV